jgi:hypothetical protein
VHPNTTVRLALINENTRLFMTTSPNRGSTERPSLPGRSHCKSFTGKRRRLQYNVELGPSPILPSKNDIPSPENLSY